MKKKVAATLAAFACASVCFGLDITTRTGTTFRKCEVVKVEPDGIRISHDGGAAKIAFEELPDALQRQYGFDAAKAAAYRKTIADAKAAVAKKLADQQAAAAQVARDVQAQNAALAKAESDRQAEEARQQSEAARAKTEADTRNAETDATVASIAIIAGWIFSLFFYFVPTIVAMSKRKANTGAIFVLNLLAGWSGIGWLVALVWAFTKDVQPAVQTVIIHASSPPDDDPPRMKEVAGRIILPRQLPPNA